MKPTLCPITCFLLLASTPGCGVSQKEAVEFNDAVVKTTQGLRQPLDELVSAARSAANWGPKEIPKLKAAYDKALKEFDTVEAAVRDLKVPNSDVAKDFHEADLAFIQSQRTMVKKDFGEIIELLEKPDPNPLALGDKIRAIFKRIDETRKKDTEKLAAVQKKFADKYKIILMPTML